MDPAVIAAIIGALATLAAAIIGFWALRSKKDDTDDQSNSQTERNRTPIVSVGRDMVDSVVGSQNTTINRQEYNVNITPKATRRSAELALVDLLTVSTEEHPKVEFKVRNNSDEVVFLKRADFVLLNYWHLPLPNASPSAMPVTWTYDVELSEQSTSVDLSQVVEANAADRFEFRVRSREAKGLLGLYVHLLEISLIYNEDNKVLKSPKVLLNVPPPVQINAFFQGPARRSQVKANKRKAQEILASIKETVVCTPALMDAIRSWAEADLSQLRRWF